MRKNPLGLPVLPLVYGVLLYLFAAGWKVFAAFAVPLILGLHEGSPRLAMLGWLALAVSPAFFVGVAHSGAHGVMNWFDTDAAKAAPHPSRFATSAWAGFLALFAMGFAAMASVLVLLALFPLPPEGSIVARLVALAEIAEELPLRLGVHAAIWVAAATLVFWVEAASRRDSAV